MSNKKPNPLRGAFSTPAPGAPPDNATEEKKPADLPTPQAVSTAPGKDGDGKKPAEPSKTATDPRATSATPDKDDAKKPAEPPKATDATPNKADDGKKPTDPPKTAEGKPPAEQVEKGAPDKEDKPKDDKAQAATSKAASATPDKAEDGEKPAEPPKTTADPKAAPAPTPDKAADGKKPTEDTPSKDGDGEIPKDFTLPITKEGQSEIITTLKVSEIHPFEGHPFKVEDNKDMDELVDSVKKFGVLEPVVVIPRKEGGYEMVSGHRRRRACELAGIATMPVIVRQLDRDEAVISMVDANLKRENISPMEKARAYKMKLEAMKHKAGRRTKEEKAAMEAAGQKPMRADEQLAQQTGESRANIQKIVRLNDLTPELQQMVEDKKLPVHTASDLSYLKKDEQDAVADAIKKEDKVPSGSQAAELKKASQEGKLTQDKIEKAVAPTKREVNPPLKVTLTDEELRPYFPGEGVTIPDVKQGIFEALALRKRAKEKQKAAAELAKKGAGGEKKKPGPER